MFGRKSESAVTDDAAEEQPDNSGAKNRPTPKRRDQERARKQPLVTTDRKAARQQEALKRREDRARMNKALVTGDDRYLPTRDKGPVRRYIRDRVDARWNIGEFLLPLMLIVFVGLFFQARYPQIANVVAVATWTLMGLTLVDLFFLWRSIKKGIVSKFGADEIPKGAPLYAAMRSLQLRRARMPKPQVERGQTIT